jgi:threonine/homoserine/homoserine lactone efflux protein
MQKFSVVFFWGAIISFAGSLPLGTMNVTITQISLQKGVSSALLFALGSMIVEVGVVRIGLQGMIKLERHRKLFEWLGYLTTIFLFLLALSSFIAAIRMSGFASPLPVHSIKPFWVGVALSATNPLHIPFWLGWTTVLMNKKILVPSGIHYNWYVAGIGIGTMFGFLIFIYGGNYFASAINEHRVIINYGVGSILMIAAIIQIRKLRSAPKVVFLKNKSGDT